MFLQVESEPLRVNADILFHIADFPVTSSMMMAFVDLIIFAALCVAAQRFRVNKPGKFQIVVEYTLESITSLIEQIVGDIKIARKIMPIVTTLIIFLLVSNLALTFFPPLTGFTFEGKPMFRSHTDDFNTTVALSFSMIIIVQIYSISKNNILGHLSKYIRIKDVVNGFKKGVGDGLMSIISVFIGILDIVSEIARIVSLSLRLFGNMFAGELLIGVLMGIFAIGLPIPIMILSLLSGVIQAIVFGALVASFLSGAIQDEV